MAGLEPSRQSNASRNLQHLLLGGRACAFGFGPKFQNQPPALRIDKEEMLHGLSLARMSLLFSTAPKPVPKWNYCRTSSGDTWVLCFRGKCQKRRLAIEPKPRTKPQRNPL